jgi:hypothetical protein
VPSFTIKLLNSDAEFYELEGLQNLLEKKKRGKKKTGETKEGLERFCKPEKFPEPLSEIAGDFDSVVHGWLKENLALEVRLVPPALPSVLPTLPLLHPTLFLCY